MAALFGTENFAFCTSIKFEKQVSFLEGRSTYGFAECRGDMNIGEIVGVLPGFSDLVAILGFIFTHFICIN